jgi:formylglycine-generating enzyme required for sulfatase activity/uncharacterized caspase-like protein
VLRLFLTICSLILAVAAVAFANPAHAQKRVALVIGNGAYKETQPLINTTNDAPDMAAALKRLGFDVLEGINLDKRAMERLIRQFDQKLAGAEIALFFYAGHGMQVSGQNHLVPVDARLAAEGDIDFESLPLNLVVSRMEREAKTSIVLLDACRDNPLARNLARTMGTRAANVGQGLAEIRTGVGTLIGFSTQPGNVALDGRGRNSPYTAALLRQIEAPGRDVMSTLAAVTGEVVSATAGRQVPWQHASLTGPVVLNPGVAVAMPAVTPAQSPVATSSPRTSEAAQAWREIKASRSITAHRTFIESFPNSIYAPLAQQEIDKIVSEAPVEAERLRLTGLRLEQDKRRSESARQLFASLVAQESATRRTPHKLTLDELRVLKPKDNFRECDVCPWMTVVRSGEANIGSPQSETNRDDDEDDKSGEGGKQRKVTIRKPFAVGKFEVTFAEWNACVTAGGCKHEPSHQGWGEGLRPVISISWNDVTREYLPWLNTKVSGRLEGPYRLLSEAEWEYSARAGETTAYSTGSTVTSEQANVTESVPYFIQENGRNRTKKLSVGSLKTVEVGSFAANAFGLHDMHGNAAEWVADCYQDSYNALPADGSPRTVANCGEHSIRGGAWNDGPSDMRVAQRGVQVSDKRVPYVGFRVARSLQ